MKYTIEHLPQSRVAIDIEIEPERVEQALNQAARRIARQYRIPGFRPGKAPRYIVESRYGRAALYEEAADDLVRESYQEVLRQGEFEPVGRAELEQLNLQPFTFRLVVPVKPTVRLGNYRDLRFPMELSPVGEEQVQQALEHLQAEQTVWKEPDPPRPARAGDRLTVDLVGYCGERLLERRQQIEIVAGDGTLLPGFEALIGAEVGQTVEISTTLPEGLEDKELAGRPATYTVTVHSIKEPEVPPLDDEFARSFTSEPDLEALRARLRRDLEEAARRMAREKVLDQMLQAIIAGAEVDMPQVMVEQEAEALYEEQKRRLRELNIPFERYVEWTGQNEESFRQQLAAEAPHRLRRLLVLQELIRAEGLSGEPAQVGEMLSQRLLDIASGALAEAPAAAPAAETDVSGEAAPAGEAAASAPAADADVSGEAAPVVEAAAPAEAGLAQMLPAEPERPDAEVDTAAKPKRTRK